MKHVVEYLVEFAFCLLVAVGLVAFVAFAKQTPSGAPCAGA
jgi:hypothetical protein